MELDEGQAAAFAQLAKESGARLSVRVIPRTEMDLYVESGAARLPFGEFDGSPINYLERWWRPCAEGWEPLDDTTSQILDLDLQRWLDACAAIGGDE